MIVALPIFTILKVFPGASLLDKELQCSCYTLKYSCDIYLLLSAVFGCKESSEMGLSLLFSSNALFWLTRDNPYHNTAILGGMWGARMDTGMRSAIDLSFRKLINNVKLQQVVNM